MSVQKQTIAVIGAGPMGLMCAYELLKQGHAVTVYERDDRIGGMSAMFDFAGTRIERFYHFICKTDAPMFALLKELNLSDKLRWRDTDMGFYYDGKLYPWGNPKALLTFPKLSLMLKVRYALMAWTTCRIKDWRALDKIGVKEWLVKWLGEEGYQKLWHPLFYYKFYQYKDELSAAWLGTRIKRVGLSRRSIFQETMGYLEGGSEVLLNAMEEKVCALGGKIVLNADVKEVICENGQVRGLRVGEQVIACTTAVSTIPLPYVSKLVPSLSAATRQQIDAIKNVGVACVLFKLRQPFSRYFWMNIHDARFEIPGMIEYTNLNPAEESILYVPYYMPVDHAKYRWRDEQFIAEAKRYLQTIRPDFKDEWILNTHVARYAFAQTVCSPNFYAQLPAMRSEIKGFYMADTAYYYPEDRSISESVQVGTQLANQVCADVE